MKIKSLSANKDHFRTINFSSGFNSIVAERTDRSVDTDSRNGVGKTTLLRAIDFCLGASLRGEGGLKKLAGEEWEFTLQLSFPGDLNLSISRPIDDAANCRVSGDLVALGLAEKAAAPGVITTRGPGAIKDALGRLAFGLEPGGVRPIQSPTFRDLLRYSMRFRTESFKSPFETFSPQPPVKVQVDNAYLLGLNWNIAIEWQRLKDREKTLDALGRQGVEDASRELAELESRRVRADVRIRDLGNQLRSFEVLPEYHAVEARANNATRQMQSLSNDRVMASRRIEVYETELSAESLDSAVDIAGLFAEAGVELGDAVVAHIDEVRTFHENITRNRREYLQTELSRLQSEQEARERLLGQLGAARARDLSLLESSGALEQFGALQKFFGEASAELESLDRRIDDLRVLRLGKTQVRRDKLEIQERAIVDLDERRPTLAPVLESFSGFFDYLYHEQADLVVNVGDAGYRFTTVLPRSGSHGVDKIAVLAYDLSLAESWASAGKGLGFLAHDSLIFDGVDERQKARAIKRIIDSCTRLDLQYILPLNSDDIPDLELEALGVDFGSTIVLTLTDDTDDGGLLGVRIP